jgi:hypothetical protein
MVGHLIGSRPAECRPAQIFYSGLTSVRHQIGVLQLVASPLPIACPFRIVALLKFSCLRPTASHRCPSWSPWGCRESCWFADYARKPPGKTSAG